MRRRHLTLLLSACGVLALTIVASAAAFPTIHAHRGGSIREGRPVFPENTLPGLREAADQHFVLEFDVKLTKNGVPVVFHDAELDRVTGCKGNIVDRTLKELARCKVDILGTEGNFRRLPKGDRRRAPIPTLASVLKMMVKKHAKANIEIKNQPTDPDFDSSSHFATVVCKAIKRSGVPQRRLIIQSFFPPNLTVAQQILPNAQTSYLTLSSLNQFAVVTAQGSGYDWVSPQWPIDQAFVNQAHAAGIKVVPYTIDTAKDMRAARAIHVDALITNDPNRARRVLRAASS